MKDIRVGFAMCGSFCTHKQVLSELEKLCGQYSEITPILSEACRSTDTRFGKAEDLRVAVERLTGHQAVDSIPTAEPIGPKALLDVLVIAPCTGNTLAKLAGGITDTAVTMAASSAGSRLALWSGPSMFLSRVKCFSITAAPSTAAATSHSQPWV